MTLGHRDFLAGMTTARTDLLVLAGNRCLGSRLLNVVAHALTYLSRLGEAGCGFIDTALLAFATGPCREFVSLPPNARSATTGRAFFKPTQILPGACYTDVIRFSGHLTSRFHASRIRPAMTETTSSDWQPPDGSWASSAGNRRSMIGNRSRDTSPELAVRRLVHAAGLRYRVAVRPVADVRRTADLVFTRRRVAVFIDGCFWHGCPEHGTMPRTNASYWHDKLTGNIARDRDTDEQLRATGWQVLRFYEHTPTAEIATAVIDAVRGNNGPLTRRAGIP